MKLTSICALAAMSLALVSCGGYNADKVKEISSVDQPNKLTSEQEETALDWYMNLQEEEIENLKEEISDVKDAIVHAKAEQAAFMAIRKNVDWDGNDKDDASAVYKERKDQIKKNNQEIEKLQKELKQAKIKAYEELGYPEDARRLKD